MRRFLIGILAVGLLAGCQKAPQEPALANSGEAGNAAAPAAQPPAQPAASDVLIEEKGDVLEFTYGWPAQAAAISALDQWLHGHMERTRANRLKSATAGAADSKKFDYPFHPYDFSQVWKRAADTPALLVLNADGYAYTGGAHGNPFPATLIWDKAKQQRLPLTALLDVPALSQIAHERFCANLDAERAKKRNTPERAAAGESVIEEFNRCVDMAKQEIIPVSKDGKAIDTLRVEIMPYEAGPYVEGIYTIDLPMDASLMAAVKPDWKAAFAPL